MQENQKSVKVWFKENRDLCVEALRIYVGVGLFLQGMLFLLDQPRAMMFMRQEGLLFFPYFGVHYIIVAHIGGGFLLIIGLLNSLAAALQIPVLCGVVLLLHSEQGLFTTEQTLEFAALILFLMVFFVVYGGGRFSVDNVLSRRSRIGKR